MNFKTTLVLLVLVVVAGVAALILHIKVPPTEKAKELEKKVFQDYDSADATKLEVKTKDKTLAFEKKVDKWHMSGPLKVRADKSNVMGVLDACESMEKVRTVEAKKGEALDPAKYGLKNPQVTVTFWTKPKDAKEEIKRTLLVGDKTPGGKNVYVRAEGKEPIYVVSKTILDKTDKEVNDFRDKTVIEIDTADVEKIELKMGDAKPIECTKKEKEGWCLTQPINDFGDKNGIEKIINKLRDLKVEKDDFITEDDSDLKKYGLDKPQATVAVYQKGAAKTLLLGKSAEGKTDKIYAKRKAEPSILAVKKGILDDLKKKPKDLRSKKVVNIVSTGDINKIEITHGDQATVIVKKDEKWTITKPVEEKADSSSVDDFLDAVKNLKVEDWAAEKADDLKKYGLDKPTEVALSFKDKDKEPLKFLIGSKDKKGGKLYVKRTTNDVVLVVKADIYDMRLRTGWLAFREKKVLEFTRSDAKKLTVSRKDKTFVCVVDDKGDWNLEKPIKHKGDKGSIDSILWDMSYLKAKHFIAENPKDLKPYGLDQPAVTAAVEYQVKVKEEKKKNEEKPEEKSKDKGQEKKDEGKKKEEKPKTKMETATLLLGNKDESGDYFAMMKGGKFVFTIRSSVGEHLNEELASKSICSFDKDIATKLILNYPSKEVVYEKKTDKGNTWWMVKPIEKKAKQSDVDDVLGNLDHFNADGIESYSAKAPATYGFDKPTLKITVTLRGEGEKVIVIGSKKKDKERYFVQCKPSNFVFLVDEADIRRLRKEEPKPPKKEVKKAGKKAAKKEPSKAKKKPAPTKPKTKAKPKAAPTKPQPKPAAKPPAAQPKSPASKPAAEQKKPTVPAKPKPEAKPAPPKPKPVAGKKPAAPPKPEPKAPAKPTEKKKEQPKPAPAPTGK
ncbi:MAG: DUF4340 domain-containing protein [Planctomycetes bacterium]|nr:DUF4340 domain-containing protein [Planctomycetota bacterium]